MQTPATGNCKQHQSRNSHRSSIFQSALIFIFLIAIGSFTATAHAQAGQFSDKLSGQVAVLEADYSDSGPMGSIPKWMEFDPPYFEYKGWFDPLNYELRTVAPSSALQTFDLMPADESGLEWPGLRVLKIQRADARNYYFSYRQQTGPDKYVPTSYTNGIGLHWGDEDGFSYFHRMIRRGDVFADTAADLVVWGLGPMTIENPELTDATRVFTLKVCNTTCSILVPPLKLTSRAIGADSIELNWQDYTHNEDGFTVEHSTDGSDWSVLGTVTGNAVSYLHSGLNVGKSFAYFRVRAYRGESEVSDWSNIASATKLSTNPGSATEFAPATNTGVDDSWFSPSVIDESPNGDAPRLKRRGRTT